MNLSAKIFIICLILSVSLSTFSQNVSRDFDFYKQGIELIVNGDKISVQSLPQNGVVEVFNILGSKVMTFQVVAGKSTVRINLPRGYYILKSDDITRKIVVK